MTEEIHVEKMQVKGKAIASIPKFVQKNFGKEGYKEWMDAIPAEAHSVFILTINPNEWYPLKETLIQPLANIAQLFYQWDIKKAAWESGRFSADSDSSGMFKLFSKAGSSNTFINKALENLEAAFQPIKCEASEINETSAKIVITRFPEIDKSIEFRIAGWLERYLEINGCKNVKIEIPKALSNRKPSTEFMCSWN